ncbi:transcriptional regulator, TetR family [Hyphomonas neptunium ATCC 15444]|uniref:Transcriptional regulator, TetR family n=2 Tax=Hyphomonas TaxID=85 RepID=Q0BZ91_HYPNA|nr:MULTISPECIES: TetR/AcrR family transcriptional regulator [Hyphomonas]ABI78300.1 transcriptional regulator, TetR family [Hyphomonas neptunium ATCC 15444]KCZ95291.1 TetR family transcriptional regulator [Hyphomonas hirschiana VP5]
MAKKAGSVGPAAKRQLSPRKPSRERGVLRFAALVDAVEVLLADHSPDEIGLYQIAEQANVPPGSVYHFFPTKEAAFLALANRYLSAFEALAGMPIDPSALESWQSLMAWDQKQAMQFYNKHPAALKLLLGGFGGLETRQADTRYNVQAGKEMYRRLDTVFHMPFVRDPETKFHITIEILDAVWGISYLKHARITEEFYLEAVDACTAYCRLFLPERIELRDEHRRSLAAGKPVRIVRQMTDARGEDPSS